MYIHHARYLVCSPSECQPWSAVLDSRFMLNCSYCLVHWRPNLFFSICRMQWFCNKARTVVWWFPLYLSACQSASLFLCPSMSCRGEGGLKPSPPISIVSKKGSHSKEVITRCTNNLIVNSLRSIQDLPTIWSLSLSIPIWIYQQVDYIKSIQSH